MDSTGKIGKRLNSLDTDAVYLKRSNEAADKPVDAQTAALAKAFGSGSLGEDTVNLSVSQAIQSAFGDDSAARSKKVADLKAQIDSGDYQVNSRLVARELANEIAQSLFVDAKAKSKDDNLLF